MLRDYIVNGRQYQFEEGTQPEGAVEVKKAVEPSDKAVKKTENKRKALKSKPIELLPWDPFGSLAD